MPGERPAPRRSVAGDQIRHRDPVSAFQVELNLQCPQGFPPRRDALQQAAKDPDERLAALQYRRDYCFASGHNVAVIASGIPDDNPSRCHTLTTTWLPTARVYRTLPEPPAGTNVPMGMEALGVCRTKHQSHATPPRLRTGDLALLC